MKTKFGANACGGCTFLGSDGKVDFYFCNIAGRDGALLVRTSAGSEVRAEAKDAAKLSIDDPLNVIARCFNLALTQGMLSEKIKLMVT